MVEAEQKVLLVDDDAFLRSLYAHKFAEHGFEVIEAGNGEEALARLREGLNPAFVVFDMVMPGTDGFALLETLTKENLAPKALKIALSNQSKPEDLARATELGADGYFIKAQLVPSQAVEHILALKKA